MNWSVENGRREDDFVQDLVGFERRGGRALRVSD